MSVEVPQHMGTLGRLDPPPTYRPLHNLPKSATMHGSLGILAASAALHLSGCSNLVDVAPSALAVAELDGTYEGVIVYTEGTGGGEGMVLGEIDHAVEVKAVAPWRVGIRSELIGEMTVTVVCEDRLSDPDLAAALRPSGSLCPNLTGNYIDLVVDSIADDRPTSVEVVSFYHTDRWFLSIEYVDESRHALFTSTTHRPTGFL